ncbi:MAG TPA: hypothetical protein VKC34_08365, partial [Blastocatellia bacterium]|nr:hypothetical protein [Blastocatellia bacterium]
RKGEALFKLFKKILFKQAACIVAIAFLSISAQTKPQAPSAGTKPDSLDERLGADDGAALAILFTANMRGNLETCD